MLWILIRRASVEGSHRGPSNKYTQHMFSWRNEKYLPNTLSYLELCFFVEKTAL